MYMYSTHTVWRNLHKMAAEDLSDIPPLEDMSEYLNKLGLSTPSKPSVVEEPAGESSSQSSKEHIRNSSGRGPVDVQTVQSAKDTGSAKKSSEGDVFGGFRKGFLLSAPTSKSSSNGATKVRSKCHTESEPPAKEPDSTPKADVQLPISSKAAKSSSAKEKKMKRADKGVSSQDVPFLKAQPGAAKQDELVIEEVQDALKKGTQRLMTDTEWISDDLVRKINANPRLRKGLTDPHFAEMLNKFNANPSEAMKEFSGDAEAMSFFQQYCSLLGQHFTDLGSKEDARREEERQRIMKMPKAERKAKLRELKATRKRMEPLLRDPKVQSALSDPRVKQIMQVLKADPEKAQRMLAEASPELLEKIQCLSVLSETVKEE